jgi:hypothetical protein
MAQYELVVVGNDTWTVESDLRSLGILDQRQHCACVRYDGRHTSAKFDAGRPVQVADAVRIEQAYRDRFVSFLPTPEAFASQRRLRWGE